MGLMVAASLYPLLLVLSISFTDEQMISMHGYQLIPQVFSLNAYQFVLKEAVDILRAYGVTLFCYRRW